MADYRAMQEQGIKEAIQQRELKRQAEWTEVLAVGNQEFVERVSGIYEARKKDVYAEEGERGFATIKRVQCVDNGHTYLDTLFMQSILWDEEKNNLLKHTRGIGFERVAVLLEQKQVLDIIDHPDQAKYPGQKVAIVDMDGYAYLVPYVAHKDGVFLKTIIPSRKATKQYLERP